MPIVKLARSRAVFFPIAGIFIYLLLFFAKGDFEKVLCRIPDDSAYFFRIAENIAAGKGSTFDGITRTNGYQPLWLVSLLPISFAVKKSPETMTRVYLVFQLLIVLGAGLLFFDYHRRVFSPIIGIAASVLFVLLVFFQSATGMETGVLMLMIGVLFFVGWRMAVFDRDAWLPPVIFGVLLGLTMLARLDLVVLGAAVCGFCVFQAITLRGHRRAAVKRLALILAAASMTVLPYLIFNKLAFGSIVPISGIIKSSFPHVSWQPDKIRSVGAVNLVFVVFAVGYLAWALRALLKSTGEVAERRYFRGAMAVLATTVLLHFAFTVLFMRWGIFRWHFIPYALFASLAVSEPLDALLSARGGGRRWPHAGTYKWAVIGATVVVLAAGSWRVWKRTFDAPVEASWHVASYRAAVWARGQTSETDVFAMKDCGNFGYFSQRRVVNLDGVVNNLDYQDVLKTGKLKEYLRKSGVQYLVQHDCRPVDVNLLKNIEGGSRTVRDGGYEAITLQYHSVRYGTYSDPIKVRRKEEVYKSQREGSNDDSATFVIWKLSNRG